MNRRGTKDVGRGTWDEGRAPRNDSHNAQRSTLNAQRTTHNAVRAGLESCFGVGDGELKKKLTHLEQVLREMKSVLVAFSGGVDSTFLLKVATNVLGCRALGVTAVSPSLGRDARDRAVELARLMDARHELIETRELEREEYASNPLNRCYFCKDELYTQLLPMARARGLESVADGFTKSDEGDWRPGRRAGQEQGVRSPLWESGFFKEDIRNLSKHLGLPTWNDPASPCLSSRIPYGERVTPEKLNMVEEGERILRGLGFRVFRVRHHSGDHARIEVDAPELERLADTRLKNSVIARLKRIGYVSVSLEPEGYRPGRMNEQAAISLRNGVSG